MSRASMISRASGVEHAGLLGAGVAFLVWVWVLNLALLVGVEVDRDLERRRGA